MKEVGNSYFNVFNMNVLIGWTYLTMKPYPLRLNTLLSAYKLIGGNDKSAMVLTKPGPNGKTILVL